MNGTMVILRIIHIFSGVLWAGGSIMMTAFIGPAAREVGADAKAFMQQLTLRSRFSPVMSLSAVLTVISGAAMYWLIFNGINLATGAGLALTVGGLLGIIAAVVGFYTQKGGVDRLKAISKNIQIAGGPPSAEQAKEIQTIQENIAKSGAFLTMLILLSLLGMSLSEYFGV